METNKQFLKSLTGQKFCNLTVVKRSETNTKSGNARWDCVCECGNQVTVIGSHLRSGHSKSCGCLRLSQTACGYSDTRIYRIWVGMHNRCYKKDHDAYKWYGDKGIQVCSEWHEFTPFRDWALTNGYHEDLSIDRIDGSANYSPDNCRWQTQKQQMNNVSSNRMIEYRGVFYTQSQFAEKFNLRYHTVVNRLRLGWDVERILNTPENEVHYEF